MKGMLTGGAGRGSFSISGKRHGRAFHQYGDVRRKGVAPEKLAPEQTFSGRGRLSAPASMGSLANQPAGEGGNCMIEKTIRGCEGTASAAYALY